MPRWTPSVWSTVIFLPCNRFPPGPRHRHRGGHRRRRGHLLEARRRSWGAEHVEADRLRRRGRVRPWPAPAWPQRIASAPGPHRPLCAERAGGPDRRRRAAPAAPHRRVGGRAGHRGARADRRHGVRVGRSGEFGPAQVLVGAAGVTAWALINMMPTSAISRCSPRWRSWGSVLVAAAVSALWHLPMATIGCIVLVTALLVTISAPLTRRWGRDSRCRPSPPWAIRRQPRRRCACSRTCCGGSASDAHQTGFIAGAVLLRCWDRWRSQVSRNSVSGWAWYLVAATSAASVLRARVWDTVGCKTWLLAQLFLLVSGVLIAFAIQHRYLGRAVRAGRWPLWWRPGCSSRAIRVWRTRRRTRAADAARRRVPGVRADASPSR